MPKQAREGDACWDLVAISILEQDNYKKTVTYGTGIAISVPEDHVALLFPRSSIGKYGQMLANSVGVIDPGYTGEVMLKFRDVGRGDLYREGEKIGQIMVIPRPYLEFEVVQELSKTERGSGGFGSTGK